MPASPLPDTVSDLLRTSSVAALAALLIVANAHREVFAWAAKMIVSPAAQEPSASPKPNGAARRRPAGRKPASNGRDRIDHRLAKRDKADERLLEAMKVSPGASIGDLAAAIGKSRSSVVTALGRLRAAGLTESIAGKWRLVEESAPKEPPPRWTKPLSGAERAHQVHLTA
jgi:DNA-binding transcriptional ArsR family regulator